MRLKLSNQTVYSLVFVSIVFPKEVGEPTLVYFLIAANQYCLLYDIEIYLDIIDINQVQLKAKLVLD